VGNKAADVQETCWNIIRLQWVLELGETLGVIAVTLLYDRFQKLSTGSRRKPGQRYRMGGDCSPRRCGSCLLSGLSSTCDLLGYL
jgi:hypothetical protein